MIIFLFIAIILYCILQVGICVALIVNWKRMRGREKELDEELDKLVRFRWYDDEKRINEDEK